MKEEHLLNELNDYIEELEMSHESMVKYKLINDCLLTEEESNNIDNVLIIRKINIRRLKSIVGGVQR